MDPVWMNDGRNNSYAHKLEFWYTCNCKEECELREKELKMGWTAAGHHLNKYEQVPTMKTGNI